jgi:hypothetical protein
LISWKIPGKTWKDLGGPGLRKPPFVNLKSMMVQYPHDFGLSDTCSHLGDDSPINHISSDATVRLRTVIIWVDGDYMGLQP